MIVSYKNDAYAIPFLNLLASDLTIYRNFQRFWENGGQLWKKSKKNATIYLYVELRVST